MRLSIGNPKTKSAIKLERYCLNCRKPLEPEAKGLYERRFCSSDCMEKYLA